MHLNLCEGVFYQRLEFCVDVVWLDEERGAKALQNQRTFFGGIVPGNLDAEFCDGSGIAAEVDACGPGLVNQSGVLLRRNIQKDLRIGFCHDDLRNFRAAARKSCAAFQKWI